MSEASDIVNTVNEGWNTLRGTPLNATIQSYVETTTVTGLITADEATAFFGLGYMFCSMPGTNFICIPMGIGFVYEWVDQVFTHLL